MRVDTDQHHGPSSGRRSGRAGTPDVNRCSPLSSHATAKGSPRAGASFESQPTPVAGTSRASPTSNPDATSPRSTSAPRIYQAHTWRRTHLLQRWLGEDQVD